VDGDFQLGEWLVHPSLNTVSDNGTSVRLEPKVMQVLVCLSRSEGETLAKEDILKAVWPETFVSDDVLSRAISELRKALQDDSREPRFIQTIAKRGYRLMVPPTGAMAEPRSSRPTEAKQISAATAVPSISGGRLVGVLVLVLFTVALLAFTFPRSVRRKGDAQRIRSVAVLPFNNLSGDNSQEYFADGMTQELIANLSQLSALKVISYTSVNRYKGTSKSLPEIARELDVDGVIEGSVMRVGDRVRITAQLVQAPEDKSLLAKTYEANISDVLRLESTVAQETANGVRLELTPTEQKRISEVHSPIPSALDAYWQGRYHQGRYGSGFGKEERMKAIEYFEQATRIDPKFSPAYVAIVDARIVNVLPRPEEIDATKDALGKALAADPNLARAHMWLARILEFHDWNFVAAEREFRRAIELDPNDAQAHDFFGDYLYNMGRDDEALKEDELAQQLDPGNDHLSDAYNHRGEYERALQIVSSRAAVNLADGGQHYSIYLDSLRLRRYDDVIAELSRLTTLYGVPDVGRRIAKVYKSRGIDAALRLWAKELERADPATPAMIAEVYVYLGDKEKAFTWLESAYTQRDGFLVSLRDPEWQPLKSDPRYSDLLRRVGLPN
jgi:TolB-like protein/DNA-binding winged helix-turn-helix (wHTH) protein